MLQQVDELDLVGIAGNDNRAGANPLRGLKYGTLVETTRDPILSRGGGDTVVTPVGEIDLANIAELKLRLLCILDNLCSPVMIIRPDLVEVAI